MNLAQKKCVACEGGVPPVQKEEALILMQQLDGWRLAADVKRISKEFRFPDFAGALAFTNAVGKVAEEEGHHPDIELGWGRVGVSLTTHAIHGLSENDFILAAKIDRL